MEHIPALVSSGTFALWITRTPRFNGVHSYSGTQVLEGFVGYKVVTDHTPLLAHMDCGTHPQAGFVGYNLDLDHSTPLASSNASPAWISRWVWLRRAHRSLGTHLLRGFFSLGRVISHVAVKVKRNRTAEPKNDYGRRKTVTKRGAGRKTVGEGRAQQKPGRRGNLHPKSAKMGVTPPWSRHFWRKTPKNYRREGLKSRKIKD